MRTADNFERDQPPIPSNIPRYDRSKLGTQEGRNEHHQHVAVRRKPPDDIDPAGPCYPRRSLLAAIEEVLPQGVNLHDHDPFLERQESPLHECTDAVPKIGALKEGTTYLVQTHAGRWVSTGIVAAQKLTFFAT